MNGPITAPSRRGLLTGALGLGAIGGAAMAPGSAVAELGEPTVPTDPLGRFFLQLAGIPGPVQASDAHRFANQIELLTWGWGAASTTDPTAGGAGSGKATPDDVVVVARTDIQSPKILRALNSGQILSTALISCTKTAGSEDASAFTYMSLKFTSVAITDYYVTPDATTGLPYDVVHLKFVSVTESVIPQKPDGTGGTAISAYWNYATGSSTPPSSSPSPTATSTPSS